MKNPANSPKKPSKGGDPSSPAGFFPRWLNINIAVQDGAFFLLGLIGALIVGWIIFPAVLYSKQAQPINFNHALHLDSEKVDGIDGKTKAEKCEFCHGFRDDGSFTGIPKLEKCTECHDDPESPLGETPVEKEFMKRYVANEKEIPWLVYSKQPDCVYFSHIAHVKMGTIACATCHGDFADNEKLPLYVKNRLTGYSINIWGKRISGFYWNKKPSDRMKMDDCARCHTKMEQEQNNACFVCHK
ncbi:MAG: cytochrome c family protein [Proteobacteria bacterium]|nr:cytochrome c family protein [Pseudomonadota bacterium]MBU1905004.1 cytochrome c family protein [Pseudomonadota bacterium]